jgi:hypothetical protein
MIPTPQPALPKSGGERQKKILNNDLSAHFKRWYPGFTHHGDPVELAA